MIKRVYRTIFTLTIWIFYVVIVQFLLFLIFLIPGTEKHEYLNGGLSVITFIISSYQSLFAVEIYYSNGKVFWNAFGQSFIELYVIPLKFYLTKTPRKSVEKKEMHEQTRLFPDIDNE